MKKLLFIMLFAIAANAQAETFTWNIGTPNASDVTAVFNTNDASLTISGNGKMQDFSGENSASWFEYRYLISKVLVEDGVANIGDSVFADLAYCTSVIIPNSVTKIGEYAFCHCENLSSITIPSSVTTIKGGAFMYCSSLTSIMIPNSVKSIRKSAFEGCGLTSITIPNSVTTIEGRTFMYCDNLTSVTIPNSVKSIGESAFGSCGLTSVTIPNSVTTIEGWTFMYCDNLTSVTIPNSVKSIGESAFEGCGLTSVTIPNSVITIGKSAFASCGRLTSVIIPNSVTTIEDYVFWNCSGLTSVIIPDSVTTIGEFAFHGAEELKSITIGKGINDIYNNAFTGGNIVYVKCLALLPPTITDDYIYGDNFSVTNDTLYVPTVSVNAYKSSDFGQHFHQILPLAPEVETEIQTTETSVEIEWEPVTDAAEYVLIVYKNGVEVARVSFDANGNIVSKTAGKAAGNFTYNLTDLSAGTIYTYTLTAYDAQNNILAETEDVFTTLGQSVSVEPSNLVPEAETMPLRVYPNPTSSSGEITLLPTIAGALIEVYNSAGLRVGNYRASAEQTTLNMQGLSAGIYFIKHNGKTVKIIKQ